MNQNFTMTQIIKLISKYSIILSFSILTGKLWLYISIIIVPIKNAEGISLWHSLPTYFNYFFNALISILLLIDIFRNKLKYYLIPLVGLFYPVMGITGLLILIIYNDKNKASA